MFLEVGEATERVSIRSPVVLFPKGVAGTWAVLSDSFGRLGGPRVGIEGQDRGADDGWSETEV